MDHAVPFMHFNLFGQDARFDLSAILMVLLTCTIVFILARLCVRKASITNPTKMQNFLEWVIEFVTNLIGMTMDLKKGKVYLGLGMTLIMYIFVSNMLGLPASILTEHHEPTAIFGQEIVTQEQLDEKKAEAESKGEEFHGVEIAWLKSPTADVSMAMALALMVILLTHIEGLRRNTRHYLLHYITPHPLFLPLNLIKEVAKPLSLGLRLYGNIFAGEVMISVIMGLGIISIPPLIIWQGFSIFVGVIQSFIFVMLTMVYMSQAVIHEEGH